mgnify:CR=1 FL=1
MGYTRLNVQARVYDGFSLEGAALTFLRERCENLRFSDDKEAEEARTGKNLGTSLKKGEIPYNQQMDVDRLCLENALSRFLRSGRKEDAFDVYFCYLEMFVGEYTKTRRMVELLSEFESNGSGLLMKHRDHYAHSVYVFALGLAIYQTSEAVCDSGQRGLSGGLQPRLPMQGRSRLPLSALLGTDGTLSRHRLPLRTSLRAGSLLLRGGWG